MKRSYLHQCHLNTQPHPNKAMKNLVEYFNHALRSEKDDRLCTLMSNVHEHELVTVNVNSSMFAHSLPLRRCSFCKEK
jgi:hypothetical protein